MIVLGIDPGFASFGTAVVELTPTTERVHRLGVIRTEKSNKKRNCLAADDNIRRAREISDALEVLSDEWDFRAVCAEAMSFPRSSSVAGKMCLAWGVVTAWMQRLDLALVQASPQTVKLAVCGNKQASKDEVQAALVKRYGAEVARLLVNLPAGQHEHPFDALGAVVACLESDVVRMGRRAAS
jgi:Holliday junction resolvasome RuvABC endonuclease subunit